VSLAATPLAPQARESFGDVSEAAEFVSMLEKFERGEINSEQYRQFRLSRGIYGQRQDGVNMVRVKIPQGVLSGTQLRVLAECADRYSRGYGHVTTRQNLQFHNVKPEDVGPFMTRVAESGLTTREACSHTVRNVAACAHAGVCGDAPFDITPYAEAVTRHFLRAPLGSGLPRKFKIAASGCASDCGQGAMNDIGMIAQVREGQRGFRLLAGGGTATLSRSAGALHDFLPAEDLLVACEAIVRVFNQEGERGNLKRARMKWAIERLGWDGFKALYLREFEAIKAAGGRPLPVLPPEETPPQHPHRPETGAPTSREYVLWKNSNVRVQAQEGHVTATSWLKLGDISSDQLRATADLAEQFGDGTVRTTNGQNLLFRWIRTVELPAFWQGLNRWGLGQAHADGLSDVVSCPGAETCRIAVTASRGVAQHVGEHLRARERNDTGADIRVSGCPNGCGQNHVAAIGLQGGLRRLNEKLVPQYHVTLGGGIDASGARFGRLIGKVPVRRVATAIDRLIAHYDAHHHPGELPRTYFQRLETEQARRLIQDLTEITEATATPEDFVDLGSSVEFKVVEMDGECAA